MRGAALASLTLSLSFFNASARGADPEASPNRKLNNLVSVLLESASAMKPGSTAKFARPRAGWIFVSATTGGAGNVKLVLDPGSKDGSAVLFDAASPANTPIEAIRHVTKGEHTLRVETTGDAVVKSLVVRSIPDLLHCGLGFDSSIKSYGKYDWAFLKKDILPNITGLVVPSNMQLPQAEIDQWHAAGKRFIAEVGINAQAKTADEHFAHWTGVLDKSPFLDGFIINEFIINKIEDRRRPGHVERAQKRHDLYEQALTRMRTDEKYKNKRVYAYIGGAGNVVVYDDVGKTFLRKLIENDHRIALERYIFERSSEQGSKDALQRLVDGIADWEAKEPGAKEHMTIAFGLFSMPPGGINKLPNVDYHVWMDQQMNVVANHPTMAGIDGLEWWTTILADEETTRFVGKLYRHYAIEGKTEMYTRDPLFMTHVQNADFEKGTEGWTLQPAEPESIAPKSFPRYGRIEGRYMGLGRPADPEHIGDTFLWMKRSEKGPNKFSQTVRNLQPGRLYSLKMLACDYQDLVEPKAKKLEEAKPFRGRIVLDGVEIDTKRSFQEPYPSNPEPKIPVWITYHWIVFRAKEPTAKLTVTDWESDKAAAPFGQEQTFNFLELQPYHE